MNQSAALVLFVMSVALILHTYLFYPLLVGLLARGRKRPLPQPDRWPTLTVLLSAYHEEKHIAARLANILAQDYPREKLQVLVGSDGSTDATGTLVRACTDLRVCLFDFLERDGKPSVLKHLVPHATGEILVFTDAATEFAPLALKNLVRHFADPRIGGVGGEIVFYHGEGGATDEGVYWKLETFLRRRESLIDSCLGATGAIYAIRRDLWPDPPANTLVDDFVVPMRVREQGRRFVYDPDALATQRLPSRVAQEMIRRIRIGAGGFQAIGLCWRSLLPWQGFHAFAFWSHKVLRWCVPFFMLAAFAANSFLVPHPFFLVTMMLQLLFYALALVGTLVRRRILLFSAPHYFVVINLALLLGFFRCITGAQRTAWQRTAR